MNLLLVAYFYPPCRDTGAHRPAAMAKYLRRLGHHVTVLTTSAYGSDPSDAEQDVVRTSDLQLLRARLHGRKRIDALYDADTYSGRPHILSRVLVPEPLIAAWAPFARARAIRLHRRRRFDCVITSSPPESVHLVGRALRRRGVPWVADVRDGWTFEPLRPPFPTGAQRRLDERLERRWLGSADAVICVSEPAAADLRTRLGIDPALVPNGWDPDQVPNAEEQSGDPAGLLDPERTSLVYTGRFGSYGRDPTQLVEGLRLLAAEAPDVAARLELVIAGPLTDDEAKLMRTEVAPARIVTTGSLPRPDALALQRAADALVLLAQPRRTQLANFKLFEYLAAERPILALAEGTEAGRIAAEAGGEVAPADDPAAIRDALRRVAAGEISMPDPEARRAYSYPAVAERMAEAIEAAVARAPRT
jgi:glycosyltransferase involved in cell wall biosynthesis